MRWTATFTCGFVVTLRQGEVPTEEEAVDIAENLHHRFCARGCGGH